MNDDARAILAELERDAAPSRADYRRDCRARGVCPTCGGDGRIVGGWDYDHDCPLFLPCDDCAGCGACGGGHHIQHCPDVRALLFAPTPRDKAHAYLAAELKAARGALDEAQEQLERAARENERLRREFQALYASAQTLVQNAGPMFVQLKQAADRAYMAAAHKEI